MINVGIIGAGRIGKVHMQSIFSAVPNAHVKLLADAFMNDEIEAWAKAHGVEAVCKDYHEIINDPEIQAVLICAPTDLHSTISIECIEAGKHVFCEKPVDHDLDKIKMVMEALKKHPEVKYQVGFNRRFDHNYEALKAAVDGGQIGDTHVIKICSRDPEPAPLSYLKGSGGIFLDMASHDFDMVRCLAGCNPVEIYAQGGVMVDPAIGEIGDVDTTMITIKMENGVLACIDNSRQCSYGYDQRAEVFGSKGMASFGNDSVSDVKVASKDGVNGEVALFFFLERYMAAYTKEVKCFIEAIENNTEVALGVEDGLWSVVMGLAAQKSLDENRPVKISEIQF